MCGYTQLLGKHHKYTISATRLSDSEHLLNKLCKDCGDEISYVENHTYDFYIGVWEPFSDTQHQKRSTCLCTQLKMEYEDHVDANNDNFCDICAYSAKTFSVTVPTSLPLVMDQDGNVNASAAQIVNNSSGDVTISSVTLRGENGWKIVPYATEMAHQKVDAKVVGFSLNGAATVKSGDEESLTVSGDWTIPQNGSLDLDYDAVISAVSQAVTEETILSAIFVLKWS